MPRVREKRRRRCLFRDSSGIHDHHARTQFGYDAKIVGDEQDRHAGLALQVAQEFENLRLDRDVERRRRLICDQEIRSAGERHGDHHALAHATRQLVRILGQAPLRGWDPHLVE